MAERLLELDSGILTAMASTLEDLEAEGDDIIADMSSESGISAFARLRRVRRAIVEVDERGVVGRSGEPLSKGEDSNLRFISYYSLFPSPSAALISWLEAWLAIVHRIMTRGNVESLADKESMNLRQPSA